VIEGDTGVTTSATYYFRWDRWMLRFSASIFGGNGKGSSGRLIMIQANAHEGFPKASKEIVLPRPHAHPVPDEGTRALATGTIHTAYPRGSRMFAII
jgi:hypothetical protein